MKPSKRLELVRQKALEVSSHKLEDMQYLAAAIAMINEIGKILDEIFNEI